MSILLVFISELEFDDYRPAPITRTGPPAIYRSADGSGNCIEMPTLGRAGSPYARSVSSQAVKNRLLPDADAIFEMLLRRHETNFKEHKGGLNQLFFAQATLIIHELFVSDRNSPWINTTSSYVDLSVLYGRNQQEQNRVRTFTQGRIHPDTFALERLMLMTPAVVTLLLMFSRYHNIIVDQLFAINESGKYRPWDTLNEEARLWQDNDLFQLGRNINVAFFAKTIICDYVSTILAALRQEEEWNLDLGKEINGVLQKTRRGGGNVVSAEFLAVYRWHAALSVEDVQWIENMFQQAFPGRDIYSLSFEEYYQFLQEREEELRAQPNQEWTFAGLTRDADGYFNDGRLAKILKDAIEHPAHQFGARSIPSILRHVEVAGIKQCRDVFNLCTMNEFRQFLDLQPFASFEEWNPNRDIARRAEMIYGHIDNLELYVGVLCELDKPDVPGSGLQPSHTLARGILADAISLIRSDRYLSHDFNASTLTQWGMATLQHIEGAHGGILSHVLFNSLPNQWGQSNTYGLLPFYTPPAVRDYIADLGGLDLYDTFRPDNAPVIHRVQRQNGYPEISAADLEYLFRDNVDLVANTEAQLTESALLGASDLLSNGLNRPQIENYFSVQTHGAVRAACIPLGSGRKWVDVVKDVINKVVIGWVCSSFGLELEPLEDGHCAHDTLAYLNSFVSDDFDMDQHFALVRRAKSAAPKLRSLVERAIDRSRLEPAQSTLSHEARTFYQGIFQPAVDDKDDSIGVVVILFVCLVPTLSRLAALVLDAILTSNEGENLIARASSGIDTDELAIVEAIRKWLRESVEYNVAFRATSCVLVDNEQINMGDTVLIITTRELLANEDDTIHIEAQRRHAVFTLFPWDTTMTDRVVAPVLSSLIIELLKLEDVNRADGLAGSLVRISKPLAESGVTRAVFLDDKYITKPFPSNMVVRFLE